jgi:AcrR family transcriptional regulator
MGRPKLLNREHVIDVALNQYWQRGIDNVGMSEISRLSGFDRAGIYKEFGGEEGLVHEVINTYLDRHWFPRIPILDSVSSPAMCVKMIFDAFSTDNAMKDLTQYGVQDKAVKWPKPVTKARGCCFYGLLISDSASTFKGATKRKIKELDDSIRAYMREKFALAHQEGLLKDGVSVDEANEFYADQCLLMQLMRRRGYSKQRMIVLRDFALKSLFTESALAAILH